MRLKIVLMALTVLLFTAGVFYALHKDIKRAHAADAPVNPYIGVMITEDALIAHVIPDSPADKIGVRHGDTITSFNDKTVTSSEEIKKQLSTLSPGNKAAITILRNSNPGKDGSLTFGNPHIITLAQREAQPLKALPKYKVLEWSGPKIDPSYEGIKGKTAVFYFTATWCAPCRDLAPDISKMYRELKTTNPGDSLMMMAVAVADTSSDRDEFVTLRKSQKKHNLYPFGIMRDTSIWGDLDIQTVPTVIIVNPEGFIVGRYRGKDLLPDKCADLKQEIQNMIAPGMGRTTLL